MTAAAIRTPSSGTIRRASAKRSLATSVPQPYRLPDKGDEFLLILNLGSHLEPIELERTDDLRVFRREIDRIFGSRKKRTGPDVSKRAGQGPDSGRSMKW